MDPLSALSLAGNVIQFVQFASALLDSTQKIYRSASGTSENVQHLGQVYATLSQLNAQLANAGQNLQSDERISGDPKIQAENLRLLASVCNEDCNRLLKIVQELSSKSNSRTRWWKSFRKAILEIRKAEDIRSLRDRIGESQGTMVLYLCSISGYAALPLQ